MISYIFIPMLLYWAQGGPMEEWWRSSSRCTKRRSRQVSWLISQEGRRWGWRQRSRDSGQNIYCLPGGLPIKCSSLTILDLPGPLEQVPLVFSNPIIWPKPVVTNALVSHVDFVPTMASLLGLSRNASKVRYMADELTKGP
jgi:hypothetical protein